MARFGTTVVIPTGLRGQIFTLRTGTSRLPNFDKRKPVGTIYTASLDVAPQDFKQGFPGVTGRFEWFGIDYQGRFWVETPGRYTWWLNSDDGSKLYIDDDLLIDNDGAHPPQELTGERELARGIHRIRVSYFQGRRFHVALVLKVAGPGERSRVFSTDEFKPPPGMDNWEQWEKPKP